IELKANHIEPKPEFMSAMSPRQVMAVCPSLIVAPERAIVRRLAQAAKPANVENRESALPDIRAVCAGNAEVQSDVRAIKTIRAVLPHAAESEHFIKEQIRCDDPAMSECCQLRQRGRCICAITVAKPRATCRAQAEGAIHQRLHDAILAEYVMVRCTVPI